jgi:hypothetical protein
VADLAEHRLRSRAEADRLGIAVLAAVAHQAEQHGEVAACSTRRPETSEPAAEESDDTTDDGGISEDEQAFLDALYEDAAAAGSGIHGFGDEWNVELGYAVCSDIENGMAPTEVVLSLQGEGEETPISTVASELVGHAQVYLCERPRRL